MTLLTEGKSTVFYRPKFGDSLEISGKNFVIRDENKEIRNKLPALAVRDIVIMGESNISGKIFHLAGKNHIPIHFLDGRGKLQGSVRYDFSKNVFLRHEQFLKHDDEIERLKIAQIFVETKVYNQEIHLKKIRAKNRLPKIILSKNLETLRGQEGSAARKYFDVWKKENLIKNTDFSFSGRWKRPPRDEVNALLSFCYSLFHAELHTQLIIAGLDPYVGFLHDQKYGHAALASDFIEIYRGIIEHWVLKKMNLKEFSEEDFEKETGDIYKLSRSGFQKFFKLWMFFLRFDKFWNDLSLVAVVERDVRSFVRFLMEDLEVFTPFKWQK